MRHASMQHWHTTSSSALLDEQLADFVAERLRDSLAVRKTATLAVSGGRTPAGFLAQLASRKLDWSRVCVTLVDERWVAEDHPDSNARLMKSLLLNGPAAQARFMPLFNAASSAHAGQPATEQAMDSLAWPLDVVVLGMGDDGHTASLFPQAPELEASFSSRAHTIAVTPLTAPHERISLTCQAIATAHCVILHITGEGKHALLETALKASPPGLPIRRVLDATRHTHVFWAP